ncbi:MAG TPA: 16S rRNA (guanine(527)-N(7))-methyltransferase RsmG [Dehalococcoidia bacterium]|nr:16S rRNA (guanine(527)-N(7))-methyltransferase RsmG [Dehalococcoidia bacterium]
MPDLASTLRDLGLDFDAATIHRLAAYRDLLAGAGFNLTSLRDRDPEALVRRHIAESLAFGQLLDRRGLLEGPVRVLDIGAGAGLPGIPLKIAWPAIRLTLIESVGKKCRFMEGVAAALGLDGVDVLEGRAEDFARLPEQRETYDLVVARAVAPLPVLVEYALPYLRLGGRLVAPKGSAALSEIDAAQRALSELGGRLDDAPQLRPPDGTPQTVAILLKDAPTPDRYPRRAGIPSKRPIR